MHLCGNPDWDFLLGLDLDILSLDIFQNGEIFSSYSKSIKKFLDRGGVIAWGIVPTLDDPFNETPDTLIERMTFSLGAGAGAGDARSLNRSKALVHQ